MCIVYIDITYYCDTLVLTVPSTGVTGYIGGDALYALATKHPELSYTALVRSTEKAEQVRARYPSVRVVIGNLGDSDLLKKEAADADIVLRE